MLRLVAGRARAQWPLLAAVLAVVTVGATLLGVCALLVTRTADRALEVAASRAAPADVEVTAFAVTIAGPDAASVAADTTAVLREATAPFGGQVAGRASSVMRPLPAAGDETPGLAYLSGIEDLPSGADLVSGRWPRPGTGEAVVLEPTARMLGLEIGRRVPLGTELTRDPRPGLTVTVVGLVKARPGTGWGRDPLGGTGYEPVYRDGSAMRPSRAFGPFLIDYGDLLRGGSTVGRLEITAHPDLSSPGHRDLERLSANVSGADRRLGAVLGDRVQIERIGSRLPTVLAATRRQQQVTASAVLAVAVLGAVLTGAALTLAGRLTADVRATETALLSAVGTSRIQLAGIAATESALLAVAATALAVPLSSLAHSWLTRLPPLDGAGLAATPAVSGFQLLAVAAGAALLFLPMPRQSGAARSGLDVVLVALAVGAWFSTRSGGAQNGIDAVRVLAPALLLAAGCAISLRLVPPALRAADRMALRARGLAWMLAVLEAARRPRAVAAGLLVTLGCAAATFAVAFDATWHRSQQDQAELSVGTDLVIALGTPVVAGQGAEVARAVGGRVSPATDRGVSVGQWLGGSGNAPRLIASNTTAGTARANGAPAGIDLAADKRLTMTGRATGPDPLSVTPQLVAEDATGLRTVCTGDSFPLDGRPHPLPDCATAGGLRLVAVLLTVAVEGFDYDTTATSDITVDLSVPGGAGWTATSAEPYSDLLLTPAVTARDSSLRMTTRVALGGPPDAARKLVATAFPDPGPLPVAVSELFASELSVTPGDTLDISVGLTPIPVTIAGVTPTVTAAPGAAALAADFDTLSRALIVRGDPQPPVDAWWVTGSADAPAAAGLHLGEVRTRTGETARLATGPVPAALPGALRLLVPAAVLLLLAGVVLHVTCDLQARAVEVARLRGLGMSRREIRTTLLGQHTLVMLPLLLTGTAVGAAATWLVSPLLVLSETGEAPVPGVAAVWPWPAEAVLLALLAAGCLLAVASVVVVQSRRADAAHLRIAS